MRHNKKHKLPGFNCSDVITANIMILATEKHISVELQDFESSEITYDFNRNELKALYRRLYGDTNTITSCDPGDKHERTWYACLIISVSLTGSYIPGTLSDVKPPQYMPNGNYSEDTLIKKST